MARPEMQNPPVEQRTDGRTFYDMTNPGPPIVAERRVATNDGRSTGSASPLILDVPLNIDSLTSHFLRSRRHEVRSQYRVLRLEEQIKALQGELSECKSQGE